MKQEIFDVLREILPNPDCFTTVREVEVTKEVVQDVVKELNRFADYCELKANAMQARLDGKIVTAEKLESILKTVYNRLTELKW